MHKLLKPAIITVCLLSISLLFFHPVFATDSSHVTETVFFGNVKDDGSACGVFTILNTVVDIMSIGIGILAIIGITIVGIKYLTAGGNEEQTRKAKHRMLQIVIGLVVYAALYAGIQFLLPGGKLDFSYRCATISDEELAQIKAEEAEKRAEQRAKIEAAKNNKNNSQNGGNDNDITVTSCDSSTKIKPKSVKDKVGYNKVVTLCNRTFKLYKQTSSIYKNYSYDLPGSKFGATSIASSGCGAVSLSIIMSGYNPSETPISVTSALRKTAKSLKLGDVRNPKVITSVIKKKGYKYVYHKSSTSNSSTTKMMRKALLSGRQLHVYVGQHKSKVSHGYHFISVLAINKKTDKVFVGNPSYNSNGWIWVDLSEVVDARLREKFWYEIYK